MIHFAVVVLQVVACLGLGASILKLFGLKDDLCLRDQLTWSFAAGFGALGWLLFFVGVWGGFHAIFLVTLLVVASLGCVYLAPKQRSRSSGSADRTLESVDWLLIAILGIVVSADFIEGLAPPADADTLAYHFALPKQFLEAGRLVFVPRAVDGAIPLLVHMTYVPVLGLGGERALVMWMAVSGWASAALFYACARRLMEFRWSLAVTLVFMTTPAVLYSAGAGHIEVRTAIFALLAAICIADGLGKERIAAFLLAGLAGGFFAGSKYFGLIFLMAAGLATLVRGRWFIQGLVFSAGAVLGGCQWYYWNWLHTGDPVFPILISRLGIGDPAVWPTELSQWFVEGFYPPESAVPANLVWLLLYPIKATFDGAPIFESGRTGFGLFVALIMPFACIALWRMRAKVARSPLVPFVVIAVAYYIVWFLFGSTQRIRHLLPVYPLVLLAVSVAAHRITKELRLSAVIAAAFAITIVVQLLGLTVYTRNYARHLFDRESRNAFLSRNVMNYGAVAWINNTLSRNDRVFVPLRHTIYLFTVPVYYGHLFLDPIVELMPSTPPERLYGQLRSQGITYVLISDGDRAFDRIAACLEEERRFDEEVFSSRTLEMPGGISSSMLFRLKETCSHN